MSERITFKKLRDAMRVIDSDSGSFIPTTTPCGCGVTKFGTFNMCPSHFNVLRKDKVFEKVFE